MEIEAKLLGWLNGGDFGSSVPDGRERAIAAYELVLAGAGIWTLDSCVLIDAAISAIRHSV
jgi:hypothetical protein